MLCVLIRIASMNTYVVGAHYNRLDENLCCWCSLESSHRDDFNEHPQHRYSWRIRLNYPFIIMKYPPNLFFSNSDDEMMEISPYKSDPRFPPNIYTEQKKKLYTYLFSHISANTNPMNIIFISNLSEFNSQQTCVNETRM